MGPSATGIRPAARSGGAGPQASLTLPGGEAVTLVVAGTRPPGTPPAEISVWIGERLVGERVLGETPTDDPVGPAGDRRPGPDQPDDSVDGVQPAVPRPVVRPA